MEVLQRNTLRKASKDLCLRVLAQEEAQNYLTGTQKEALVGVTFLRNQFQFIQNKAYLSLKIHFPRLDYGEYYFKTNLQSY